MSRQNWQELIRRYAGGRPICNCGDAYYTRCGHAWIIGGNPDGSHKEIFNSPVCKHGCGANQIAAKEYIAGRVLADLGDPA